MHQTVAHHRPTGRTLHLIDVENLAGSPYASRHDVRRTLEAYCGAVTVRPDDHAVLAMNANNGNMAFAAHQEWKRLTGCNCVIKVGHGEDGADDALLHTCDPLRIAERYGRVVVGSGDHKFADLVLDLRDHGTLIGLVSREAGLSHMLACTTPIRRIVDVPVIEVPNADRPTMPTPRRRPRRSSQRTDRRRLTRMPAHSEDDFGGA